MTKDSVKIGCWSGFWGDSTLSLKQLLSVPDVDYLVGDFLAEMTMSILVMQRERTKGKLGYASDFVTAHLGPLLREISEKKVKIVSNAGGVNVEGCRAALEAACRKEGVSLRIGIVSGDDLLPRVSEFATSVREMFSGAPFPPKDRVTSVNAYLGACPIAACLKAGCDIVITGRVVDSALVLGPLMHEFGWQPDQLDLLAAGTLVGHVLECGAQSTGGLFTDCIEEGLDAGWSNIGYPIACVTANGEFDLSKPENTGGLISVGTVSEQILYEIGDPSQYIVPDVICDFTHVQVVPNTLGGVHVKGARSNGVPSQYKVCATYRDGFKITGMLLITGQDRADARAKAKATGEALLRRIDPTGESLTSLFEYFGEERVILRLSLHTENLAALRLFGAEFASPATSMAPGTSFLSAGKPRPVELVRLFSFLLDKNFVHQKGFQIVAQKIPPVRQITQEKVAFKISQPVSCLPLSWLCFARSGDKGDNVNIALIARHPSLYAILLRRVSAANVLAHFTEHSPKLCERFEVGGISALNFLLHNALGGGGMASLRCDSLGKGFGQELLRMQIGLDINEWNLLAQVGFKTRALRWQPSAQSAAIVLCDGRHNTMNATLVRDLTRVVTILEKSDIFKFVTISATGSKSFCAGADLNEFSQLKSSAFNDISGIQFAELFRRLNALPVFLAALVEGNCVGGGMGLISCCDWVLASPAAKFGLPELKLGMVPATIYPFVRARIGAAATRRLTLLGPSLGAEEAKIIGLVDQVVNSTQETQDTLEAVAAKVGLMGPVAIRIAKQELISKTEAQLTTRHTGKLLARIRISPEVAEGVAALKQRRLPLWVSERSKI